MKSNRDKTKACYNCHLYQRSRTPTNTSDSTEHIVAFMFLKNTWRCLVDYVDRMRNQPCVYPGKFKYKVK